MDIAKIFWDYDLSQKKVRNIIEKWYLTADYNDGVGIIQSEGGVDLEEIITDYEDYYEGDVIKELNIPKEIIYNIIEWWYYEICIPFEGITLFTEKDLELDDYINEVIFKKLKKQKV